MALIIGTNGDDDLTGGPTGDTILALGGKDKLRSGILLPGEFHGGTGDDTYYISGLDTIVELAGEGRDTVRTTLSDYVLPANVEDLVFTGSGPFAGHGNGLNNWIIGGSDRDRLEGGDGTDTLESGGGDDILDGGAGFDTMLGGLGNDTYYIDGQESVQDAGGIDTLVYTVAGQFTMFGGIENAVAWADGTFVTGNGGNNSFVGGTGSQTFVGRGGSESFDGGAGSDTVSYEVTLEGVQVDLNLGRATRNGWGGSDVLANIENVQGSMFADVIVGNADANILNGVGGGDVLAGLDGDDILFGSGTNEMIGGNGNDIYYYARSGDTLAEFAGGGADTVFTYDTTFVLPDHVETVVYLGATSFLGIGGSTDNSLKGGDAGDSLSGLGGSDILVGGSGNDELQGGSGSDWFRYVGGETGLDRILDFAAGSDKLQVSSAYYAPVGSLAFVSGPGAAANSGNATFLYDTDTGIVSFDSDGTGAAAAVQLAQLNTGLVLSVNDFGVF